MVSSIVFSSSFLVCFESFLILNAFAPSLPLYAQCNKYRFFSDIFSSIKSNTFSSLVFFKSNKSNLSKKFSGSMSSFSYKNNFKLFSTIFCSLSLFSLGCLIAVIAAFIHLSLFVFFCFVLFFLF